MAQSVKNLPEGEMRFLKDLRAWTKFDGWKKKDGWKIFGAAKRPFGVSMADGHIVKIDLTGNNLGYWMQDYRMVSGREGEAARSFRHLPRLANFSRNACT